MLEHEAMDVMFPGSGPLRHDEVEAVRAALRRVQFEEGKEALRVAEITASDGTPYRYIMVGGTSEFWESRLKYLRGDWSCSAS